MRKKRRDCKYCNCNNNNGFLAHQEIYDSKKPQGEPVENLLFRPLISSSSVSNISFEHIHMPFLIKSNLLFILMFMDGCGDVSVYVECYETDPKQPFKDYKDGLPLMRECLEVQKHTGVDYYFGKLDNAIKQYLYGIQLCIDKGYLTKDKALEIIKELDAEADDMVQAAKEVERDIFTTKVQREQRRSEARQRADAGNLLMNFLNSIMGNNLDDSDYENDITAPDAETEEALNKELSED